MCILNRPSAIGGVIRRCALLSAIVVYNMVICAIVGCGNRSNRDKGKGFYRLPKVIKHQGDQTESLSRKRQSLWLARIKREDVSPEQYSNIIVCGDHFLSNAPSKLYDVNNPD